MNTGYKEDVIGENAHGEELFAFHYRPLNLYQLAKKLELQADETSWQPDRQRSREFAKELLPFDSLVVHFFKWIDHQVGSGDEISISRQ